MPDNLLPLDYDLGLRKSLRRVAIILFILSLCLPAVGGAIGLVIWMTGLTVFWYPASWPTFANVIFFVLYIRLKDDKETLYLFPCLMLILMIPGSIFVLPGVFGWGYVVWVMSGMLLCADWLCSLMPHKQRLIVRLAIMICLIWAVGLIGLGQYQQNSNDQDIFEDLYFSVFYNPLGIMR